MKRSDSWRNQVWTLRAKRWQLLEGQRDRACIPPLTRLRKWLYRLSLMLVTAILCVTWAGGVTAHVTPTITSPIITSQTTPQSLLNQGRSLYESGQLTEALNLIQAAIDQYRTQENGIGEAVALSNLALVQEQRGALLEAERAIAASIDRLITMETERHQSDTQQSALAQSLNVQARIQLAQGQAESALETLEQAIALFTELGDSLGTTRSKIRQAETLQTLGFHQAAIALLQPLYDQLKLQPNSAVKVSTMRHLAHAYYQVGQLTLAESLMTESLQLATQLNLPQEIMAAELQLANILQAQAAIARSQGALDTAATKAEAALKRYNAIAQLDLPLATRQVVQVQARLNRLSLLIELERTAEAVTEWQAVQDAFTGLPPSRPGLYARMNLAKNLMRLQTIQGATVSTTTQAETRVIEQDLQEAMQYAYAIGDRRAETYALGYLGELYEAQYAKTKDINQWQQAKQFTQQALFLATQIDADDIAYQWQWQMGRLLTTQVQLDRGSSGNSGDSAAIPATDTTNNTTNNSSDINDSIDNDSIDNKILDEAIAAYTSAIHLLEGLRRDLVTVNREVQFSFQENVEPIHRELVNLLLKKDDIFKANNNGISSTPTIQQAQQTIESLQLVELTNFLREACVNVETVDNIGQVLTQTEAAVIYPIILGDRLEIIVSLPNNASTQAGKQTGKQNTEAGTENSDSQPSTLHRVSVPIAQPDLEDMMIRFRDGVYNFISLGYRPLAEQAYDILIRPIESELAASPVETLVFVLDGVLRNIPMGALNDGEQFLVEKYSLALTPGIQLLPNLLASNSLQDEQLSVAALGLSEGVQGFLPLPNVANEIEQIKTVIPDTRALLNQGFTTNGFADLLSETPAPIVHLATHGQFSSQQENTFVLTWDEKINIGELSRALQTGADRRQAPIELLVLSACETASGDSRAALGLAGVAIRAGARSTVASLWQVDDAAAAAMMGEFYRQIASQQVSKAEALRQAQLAILNNPQYRKHPYYWAPFVLVGNWR